MWWKEGARRSGRYKYKKRRLNLADSRFHWKYFFLFMGSSVVFSAIAFSIITYFVMQNYDIFIEHAYANAPNFLPNLEFEKKWILIVIASCFFGMQFFIGAIFLKLMHSLVYPLQIMRKHISNLTKGDLAQPEIRVRMDSDYQDLVQTYNYYYRTLQRHSQQELKNIMDLEISKNAFRSKKLWHNLVETKYEQLNGSSSELEKAPDSYRVS